MFSAVMKDPGERRAALAKSKQAESLQILKAEKQRKEDAKKRGKGSLKPADVFSSDEDSDEDGGKFIRESDSSDNDSDDGKIHPTHN